jgi:hypothetical protein
MQNPTVTTDPVVYTTTACHTSPAAQARRNRALHDDMAAWRATLGHVPTSQEILNWMDEREGKPMNSLVRELLCEMQEEGGSIVVERPSRTAVVAQKLGYMHIERGEFGEVIYTITDAGRAAHKEARDD